MNETDDSARFTIRDDETVPDTPYMADAENLRIDKLSIRITLVAILIPCLLVVVLAVAYLDIRNRVISTQTSGSMGVQNLAKDLDSRFSSLSLKQATIEENLAEQAKAMETATAGIQVNMKKRVDELQRIVEKKTDQAALDALNEKTQATLADLQKAMSELNAGFDKFDEELASQILRIADGMKKDQELLSKVQKRLQQLENEKLSKESLDLAIGLERLSLQEMVKGNIRTMDNKLAGLEKKLTALNQRLDSLSRSISTAAPVRTYSPPPPETSPPSGASGPITEQTIN
ncbi:hypothetical protein [Desulfosarcina ovata]|uniref:Uncharacterized protein n=1 Tax=Desulfosarcina ovata subsp. ovata TaxID=2752305 RepID=A0A5K8A6W3_9BACT|nr:hypothetical protein [Desulfosarcina ovata]BBO88265.1 hypothetical protein DSCOOX_14450 [Desulfosarcina ovata subsp. ovata]